MNKETKIPFFTSLTNSGLVKHSSISHRKIRKLMCLSQENNTKHLTEKKKLKSQYSHRKQRVFWVNMQNQKLICVIGTVQSYLGFWGERLNFDITVAEIQPKVWERRRKRWREKMLNFGNDDTEFPLPSSAARAWSAWSEKEKKKKFWQTNCGNAIAEIGV